MGQIKQIIYCFGLMLMMLAGTLYGILDFITLQPILLAASIIIICVCSGKLYLRMTFQNRISLIWWLFVVFIAVSFIAHTESTMIVTVFGLVLLSYTLLIEIPGMKSSLGYKYENDMKFLIAVLTSIQLYSTMHDFTFYRFSGIYSNSNFTGGEAATLCVLSCATLLQGILNKRKYTVFMSIATIVFSIVIGLATNSRTAVFVIVIILLLTMFFALKNNNKNIIKNSMSIIIVAMTVIAVLSLSTFVRSAIDENMIKITAREGNELADRQLRWIVVLNRLNFFGNGEESAIGTHNTFLSMLDQYGYIPFFLLILFIVMGVIRSFKLASSKKMYDMKYLPLFCFICFGITCMFEQMLLKNIMYLCMYSVPILTQIRDGD